MGLDFSSRGQPDVLGQRKTLQGVESDLVAALLQCLEMRIFPLFGVFPPPDTQLSWFNAEDGVKYVNRSLPLTEITFNYIWVVNEQGMEG